MININKHIRLKVCYTMVSVLLVTLTGCGSSSDEGNVVNTQTLPSDTRLTLWCGKDTAIAKERCILDDPENKLADIGADCSENGAADKFRRHTETQSIGPKANFYLWGTYQASCPVGENQYYTALALHNLSSFGSELVQQQAINAYRSVLDNYFDSATFFEIPPGSGRTFSQRLKELTAKELLGREVLANNRIALFDSEDDAEIAIGKWGYTISTTGKGTATLYTITKNQ